jgi:periplasmic protein TonB
MTRRSTNPGKTEQNGERMKGETPECMAELGSLSQCMVDADSAVLARARRLRGRALLLSVALQAVCILALLIGPLLAAPAALPPSVFITPVPPYRGGGAQPSRPHVRASERQIPQVLTSRLVFHPESTRRPEVLGESAPVIGPTAAADLGPGTGSGPGILIPGGGDEGIRVAPPRQPIAPRKPVQRSEGVMTGSIVHRVDPVYPAIARAIHLSGTVRLRAIIGTDGTVQNLEVLSGSPILARAAVDAVRQWRYRPTQLNGQPVEVETYITVNFVLGE